MELKFLKPLFKNITRYNSKNYNNFIKFHGNKYNTSYGLTTLLLSIMLIYCSIINLLNKNFLLGLFLFLALILFLYCRLYLPVKRYNKTTKEYKNNKQIAYTFVFYEYFFTINKKRFYYFKLHKVFETKDYFYLYINDNDAALVSKTGFNLGNCNDFTNFIKKKCFLKYKTVT